jgi:hypothetical protein
MSSDIEFWLAEYTKEVDALASLTVNLKSLSNSGNAKATGTSLSECELKINKIKEVRKSFSLELRLVKDRGQKAEYDAKAKVLDDRANEYTKMIKDVKHQQQKADLVGSPTSTMGAPNPYETQGKNNDDLLTGANKIQDLTVESLVRTAAMIEASKDVGEQTLEELRRQKEQIKNIEAEVQVIDSNLQRAEKLILNFGRRMATDKLIQGFATVNILIMLGLILYVAISGKSLSASTGTTSYVGPNLSSAPTPSPTARR